MDFKSALKSRAGSFIKSNYLELDSVETSSSSLSKSSSKSCALDPPQTCSSNAKVGGIRTRYPAGFRPKSAGSTAIRASPTLRRAWAAIKCSLQQHDEPIPRQLVKSREKRDKFERFLKPVHSSAQKDADRRWALLSLEMSRRSRRARKHSSGSYSAKKRLIKQLKSAPKQHRRRSKKNLIFEGEKSNLEEGDFPESQDNGPTNDVPVSLPAPDVFLSEISNRDLFKETSSELLRSVSHGHLHRSCSSLSSECKFCVENTSHDHNGVEHCYDWIQFHLRNPPLESFPGSSRVNNIASMFSENQSPPNEFTKLNTLCYQERLNSQDAERRGLDDGESVSFIGKLANALYKKQIALLQVVGPYGKASIAHQRSQMAMKLQKEHAKARLKINSFLQSIEDARIDLRKKRTRGKCRMLPFNSAIVKVPATKVCDIMDGTICSTKEIDSASESASTTSWVDTIESLKETMDPSERIIVLDEILSQHHRAENRAERRAPGEIVKRNQKGALTYRQERQAQLRQLRLSNISRKNRVKKQMQQLEKLQESKRKKIESNVAGHEQKRRNIEKAKHLKANKKWLENRTWREEKKNESQSLERQKQEKQMLLLMSYFRDTFKCSTVMCTEQNCENLSKGTACASEPETQCTTVD